MGRSVFVAAVVAWMALVLGGTAAFAQDKARLKEIHLKMKTGERLTDEERRIAEGMARRAAVEKGRDVKRGGKSPVGLVRPVGMNVVDEAQYSIAEIEIGRERYKEAIAELQRVVEKSPDENAVSAAGLSIGNVHREYLKDADASVEQYRQVKGDFADEARRAIVDTYRDAGDLEKAAAELEKLIAEVTDKREKVSLLREAANLYSESGNQDKAIAALRQIADTVSYEEAKQMQAAGKGDPRSEARRKMEKFERAKEAPDGRRGR